MEEHARYYTRGVRFPRLVGRTADGTRIPGGPYTLLQAVGGLLVFVVGQWTRPLWSGHGLLVDYTCLASAVFGVVFALRFARPGGRDPVTAAVAVAGLYLQPRTGALNGRGIRIRRPHRVIGRITVLDPQGLHTQHQPPPAPVTGRPAATPPTPPPAPGTPTEGSPEHSRPARVAAPAAGVPAPALSSVARLLASACGTDSAVAPPAPARAAAAAAAPGPARIPAGTRAEPPVSVWGNTPSPTTPSPTDPRPTDPSNVPVSASRSATSPVSRTGPEGASRA